MSLSFTKHAFVSLFSPKTSCKTTGFESARYAASLLKSWQTSHLFQEDCDWSFNHSPSPLRPRLRFCAVGATIRTVSWLSYTQFRSCQKELKISCGQTIVSPASKELGPRVARGWERPPQKQQPDDTKPLREISLSERLRPFLGYSTWVKQTNKQKGHF